MKTICLLFAVAFLVFQVQASTALPSETESKDHVTSAPSGYQEDDHGLEKNAAVASRMILFGCFGSLGYCLPRNWQCLSEKVFKEEFNDCSGPEVFKCCVL